MRNSLTSDSIISQAPLSPGCIFPTAKIDAMRGAPALAEFISIYPGQKKVTQAALQKAKHAA